MGVIHHDSSRPVDADLIRGMCGAMAHRGPDDEGLFVEGPVGLGMRRLSIIDLAGGRQPIFNEDRSKVIVLNGEIYNYRELRTELLARGHRLQSRSDTETVLHLYEEVGPACVERLRGMFAFAIWDRRARTLMLARDRFGIKPLYLATGPWGLAFASELKALVGAGLTRCTPDWEALDSFLQLGYIPAPRAPFQDVCKLEPGHVALWRPGSAPVHRRYWDLPSQGETSPPAVEQEVVRWLDQSVAAHLVSDVPVAAFLSGGLDSSAVVASMAVQGASPHAFTARYAGSGAAAADETELARILSARYGVRLTIVDVHPNVQEVFEPIVWALDEPHADDSALPTWLISQAVGREYKVALTGIGGDELFVGYRRHIGLLAGRQYGRLPDPLLRAIARVAMRLREPQSGGLGVDRLKRFVASYNGAVPVRYLAYLSRVADAERRELYRDDIRNLAMRGATAAHFTTLYREAGAPDGIAAGLYLDYKTFLPDDILALSDRVAMAHSLEIRVPFVDHLLVEGVFGLPDGIKIGLWQRKRLLRRALRARLPRAHLRAPKRGFVGPTASWLRHELRELLLDELSPERLGRLGYFEPGVVARLLEEHDRRVRNREGILWALLCFSTWHRLYLEAATPASYPRH